MAEEAKGRQGRRRSLPAEFKLEAVRRIDEQRALGVPMTQIASKLGVTDDMLRGWKLQAEARGAAAGTRATDVFSGHGRLLSEHEELRRLKRGNARLQQEVSFLKIAALGSTGRRNSVGLVRL